MNNTSSTTEKTSTQLMSRQDSNETKNTRSSIAARSSLAKKALAQHGIGAVCGVIMATIILVYPVVFCVVEYGLFHGNTDYSAYRNEPETNTTYVLGVTASNPTDYLTDAQFMIYVGFIMWFTMVLTGLGMEILVWFSLLRGSWSEQVESYWRVAQFLFPLIIASAVGLAMTRNFWALPILTFGMYKFGFPETILYLYAGLYDTRNSPLERASDLINGVGTVLHHSASAMYIAMLVTGAVPVNRHVLNVALPLVMQHWFVLLKYHSKPSYIIPQLVLEGFFEWEVFGSLEPLHSNHWIWGVIAGVMIFAHWCYLIAGGLSLLVMEKSEESYDPDETLNRMHKSWVGVGGDSTPAFPSFAHHRSLPAGGEALLSSSNVPEDDEDGGKADHEV